jgi:hypothetical protein
MRPRGERPPAQEAPKKKVEVEEEITADVQNGPPIFEMGERVQVETTEPKPAIGGEEVADKILSKMSPEDRIQVPEKKETDSFAQMLAADVETLNARIDAAEKEQTPETTSVLRSVFSRVNKLRNRLSGLLRRRETPEQQVEAAPEIDPEKLSKALELKVELPENPSSDEIREAMLKLIGNLPELKKLDGTFSDESSIIQSLSKDEYDIARSRVDSIIIQDVLREQADTLHEQYPERKDLYDQLDRLARAFGHINNKKVKRGQLVGNKQIAHGILATDTISRREYDRKQGKVFEVAPTFAGEITFTDEERAAARAAMPEVVAVQEKMLEEARQEANVGGAFVRIPRKDRKKVGFIQERSKAEVASEPGTLQEDGSITFTDEERAAARERLPEIAKLQDDVEVMVGDDDLGAEIDAAFDSALETYQKQFPEIHPDELELINEEEELEELPAGALEPLEQYPVPAPTTEKPVEHVIPLEKKGELVLKPTEDALPAVKKEKPLSVREKHGPVTQTTTMEQRRSAEIKRVRAEIARIQEQIVGKEQRLATELQWWKLGESSRIARKATKEAIVKLQEQLRAQNWAMSDLLNAPKIATRDEMSQYPRQERQKKQRYSKKAEDFRKRTGRRAS